MLSETRERTDTAPRPSVRAANLLFLLCMVLLITLGSLMQLQSFAWGLIGTEVLLLLLPTLLFVRFLRLPARDTLRLRGLDPILALLSVGIGVAIWPMAVWVDAVMSVVFGYTVMVGPDAYPTTLGQAALLVVALAVAAPICEEVLFRGAIQRAYERYGPIRSILLGGLLFTMFHLRLSGFLALVPIALALGYVVWRSNSLLSGILMHAANNALAALMLAMASLSPGTLENTAFPSLPIALAGGVLALLGVWLFHRRTRPEEIPGEPGKQSRFSRHWPVAVAVILFVALAAVEVLVGRVPEVMATDQRLILSPAPWQAPAEWRYELSNVVGDPVGEAVCQITPVGDGYTLECEKRQEAFEVTVGGSLWSSDSAVYQSTIIWERDPLRIAGGVGARESLTGPADYGYELERVDDRLLLTVEGETVSADMLVPADGLLTVEWPWRLSALPFSLGYAREVGLAWPVRYRPATQDSGPVLLDSVVVIRGAVPLSTPQGSRVAWVVEVDEQTAWYDAEAPHDLLRLDDGFHTWELVERFGAP